MSTALAVALLRRAEATALVAFLSPLCSAAGRDDSVGRGVETMVTTAGLSDVAS